MYRLFKDSKNPFHDQLIVLDEDGLVTEYLEAKESAPLFIKEQVTGKLYSTVFPVEMGRRIKEAIEDAGKGEEYIRIEYKLILKGIVYWFDATLTREQEKGKTTYVIVARDISDLKNSQLFYTGVLDSSISGIMAFKSVRDANNNIIDFEWIVANKTAETIIGIPADEIVGKSLLDVMPGNKNEGIFDKYIDVVETGKPMEHERSYELQGIYKIWFHITATKLNDGFALTFQNVTKRKSAEMALVRNEELFRSLFDKAGIGIALLDDRNVPFKVNDKLTDILGYPAKALSQMSLAEITHPEDRHNDDKQHTELLQNKREVYKIDKRYIRQDGKTIWTTLTATAVKDESGNASFIILMVEDISYRKEAEEALLISETRWMYALEGAGDGVWDWNIETNEVFYSPQWKAMLGYEDADIGNTLDDWQKLVHSEDAKAVRAAIDKYLKGEETSFQHEYRMLTKAGSYKWILSRGKTIEQAENGAAKRMIGTNTDITERREQQESILRLNRELEELNNRKNKLISIIGHDLRSPFASITTLLSIIQQDWEHTFPDELKKYFELLTEKVEVTYGLLDSLLTWSRTHMDKVTYNPSVIPFNPLVEDTLRLLQPMAEKKSISIITNVPAGTEVYADGDMIQTVVRNLISNAIKFTQPQGQVTVLAEKSKEGLVVSVADTGVGITPEDIEKILNPNLSYTSFGTSGEKGTGLGLDICRDFIEKHGGKLQIESTPGKGTKFSFNIPPAPAKGGKSA